MSRPTRAILALPLTMMTLAGCFDQAISTGGSRDTSYPPLTTAPFDRDLPPDAYLTTVHQRGDTVYFFGGRRDDGRAVDSVWAFDIGRRAWIERSPMPTARYYAGAVSAGGFIYVIGGRDRSVDADASDRLQRTVERYDPATDTWSSLPPVDVDGFDASYPTTVTSARGRIFAISTARTHHRKLLFESADGVTWTRTVYTGEPSLEPTLISDGRDLFVLGQAVGYWSEGFQRIDPNTKQTTNEAFPAYYARGMHNRWLAFDGSIYLLNGGEAEDDRLAVFTPGARSWGFNGVPFDITSNRHFVPIVTDRGSGELYFFAPPEVRVGVHYSTVENRFW